jgi:hypothetical protein
MDDLSNKSTLYSTSDLGIATYLLTVGVELISTTPVPHNPSHLIFHFKEQENIRRLISDYLNGDGLAPARTLFENYRALRALAFNQNKYEGGRG